MADVGGAEGLAFQRAEHGRAAGKAELAAGSSQIQQRERVVVHPDDPLAVALSEVHVQRPGVWGHVA